MKTIRIFISSTFRDMHSERDYLVKYVFPELSDRCQQRGLNLVPIDLRWGVTEEEAEKGKALEICLEEIENCRPFFIGILGERYGWVPEKYDIPPKKEFDWLSSFEQGHSITALEIYQGVLKSKDMKTRAFFYFRDPAFMKEVPASKLSDIQAESEASAKKLFHLKQNIKDTYDIAKQPGHYMDGYTCRYKGLRVNWAQVKADIGSTLSTEDLQALEKVAGDGNLADNQGYAALNEKQRAIIHKYGVVYLDELETFGNEVLNHLWKVIDQEHPKSEMETDPLLVERNIHEGFLQSRTRQFIGREDILNHIAHYADNEGITQPLFLLGEPGTGKSALMAMACLRYRLQNPQACTIARFVGISPDSNDIFKLLKNIIQELATRFDFDIDHERLEKIDNLAEYFGETLSYLSNSGHKVLIAIDALNQLHPAFDPQHLVWLPKLLPGNVKIILSTLDGEYINTAQRLGMPVEIVGNMEKEHCRHLIKTKLGEYRKSLTEEQIQNLLSKTEATKPLYLSVACEELRVFPSFELINTRIATLPQTIPRLFEDLLDGLEHDHGRQLVKDALCLIECSMYGLTENELLVLLRRENEEILPANIWIRLYRHIALYLTGAGDANQGLLNYFHQQFSFAVRARYLTQPEIEKHYYRWLAQYGMAEYEKKPKIVGNCLKYTGIYLYKTEDTATLTGLLADIFKEEDYIISHETIADELFAHVVTTQKADEEKLLKTILENISRENENRQLAIFFDNQGNRYKSIGYSTWALVFFESLNIMLVRFLAIEPDNTNLRKTLSAAYSNVGQIYMFIGEGKKGLEFFEKSLKITEKLVALEPERTDFRRDSSFNLNNIGNIYSRIGQGKKALECYERSLIIMEELIALEPGRAEFIRTLSASLNNLGQQYFLLDRENEALVMFVRMRKTLEELLVLEPARTDYQRELSVSFSNIGQTYQKLGNAKESMAYFEKQKSVLEELITLEPGRTDFRRDLSVSLNNIARVYKVTGKNEEALGLFESMQETLEDLVSLEPNRTDFKKDLSVCYGNLGQIYMAMERQQKGIEFFEKACETLEELIILEPGRVDILKDLSVCFDNLGNFYSNMELKENALESYEKSLEIKKELMSLEYDRTDFKKDLCHGLYTLGKTYLSMGKQEKALSLFLKQINVSEELLSLDPSLNDIRIALSVIYGVVGNIYYSKDKNKKALKYFEKLIEIDKELVVLEPRNIDFLRSLSSIYSKVGQIYQAMEEEEKAFELLISMQDVLEKLVVLEPDNIDFKMDYAISQWNAYLVCSKEDEITWLNKTKSTLHPMIEQGVDHEQLQQLWGMVNEAIEKSESELAAIEPNKSNSEIPSFEEIFQETMNRMQQVREEQQVVKNSHKTNNQQELPPQNKLVRFLFKLRSFLKKKTKRNNQNKERELTMKKRLQTVIAIIALGFIIYFVLPYLLKVLIYDNAGITNYQMQSVAIWLSLIGVVLILFGIGRIKDYAATAGYRIKKKVIMRIYTGLFLLILPYVLPFLLRLLDIVFPVSYHLTPVLVFINKTMIHFVGAAILLIWGIKTAWDNKEQMEDRPVFEAFISHFSNLTRWGWGFHIFLALLVAGSVFFLVDGMPAERPQDSVATIAVPGSLNWDPAFNNNKPETVERNDTIKKIHLIKETRMLITMADGSYGWYDIPFIKSAQGWNGYLFGSINTSDLKVSPDRNSRSIPAADKEGYRKGYQKDTDIKILELHNEPKDFEKNKAARSYAMWAKVSVRDSRAETDVTGWIPYGYVRIHGQMHNSSIPWLWIPIKRLNAELGGGFLAGLANIILILIFVPATAFIILKFISSTMRFIPNFFLSILLIITTLLLLFVLYFSFFDPSAFNWSNWNNAMGNYVYLGILLIFGAGIIRASIQSIYETRCPECKYWEGYVYNRELLSRSQNRYKYTTTSHYTDGSSKVTGERYETHINEDWKDFCKCGRCGNRWNLRRHEHEKK